MSTSKIQPLQARAPIGRLGRTLLSLALLSFVVPVSRATIDPPDASPRYVHAPMHDEKFENLVPFVLPTWGDLANWYWHWWLDGGTKPPQGGYASVPVRRPDLSYLAANRRDTTVTWVGHATLLVQVAGLNVMTDPQFSDRAFFVDFMGPQRKVRVPFTIAESPRIDVVVVSHNHYDHLDAPSIDALAKQPGGPPLFVVPRGVDAWLAKRGITNVAALDWWDARDLPSVSGAVDRLRVTMVPVAHWSARSPFDRFETLWGGYVLERFAGDGPRSAAGTTSVPSSDVASGPATEPRVDPDDPAWRMFFAGDTGYAPFFRELVHRRFPRIDFAAIPIGAYEPNRYLHAQHVTPAEAVWIHRDLEAKQSIGIHWGTFVLTTEPFDQPPKDLAIARAAAGLPDDAFVVFEHGETRVLERAAR